MFGRWIVAAALLVALAAPASAYGAGAWGWPVEGSVALRYAAPYTAADGRACTHGGLDIAASAGDSVNACCAGEVVFAGLVPGGTGKRVWAVTVLTGDGLRVSYLPLASASVKQGGAVVAGDRLGTLSSSGDASDAGTHLHLGVKHGNAALDPLTLLEDRAPVAGNPASSSGGTPAGPGSPVVRVPASHAGPALRSTAPYVARAPVGSPAPAGSAAAVRSAGAGALTAATLDNVIAQLVDGPPIARIEPLAAPATLNAGRARADLMSWRGAALTLVLQAVLFLVAAGCVWSVVKTAGAAGAQAAPSLARRARG
jgi:hypothetical protein